MKDAHEDKNKVFAVQQKCLIYYFFEKENNNNANKLEKSKPFVPKYILEQNLIFKNIFFIQKIIKNNFFNLLINFLN